MSTRVLTIICSTGLFSKLCTVFKCVSCVCVCVGPASRILSDNRRGGLICIRWHGGGSLYACMQECNVCTWGQCVACILHVKLYV